MRKFALRTTLDQRQAGPDDLLSSQRSECTEKAEELGGRIVCHFTDQEARLGIAQIGARYVGAVVVAVDPFDAATEKYWRQNSGFRASLTRRKDADGLLRSRLWLPLAAG